MDQIIIVIHVLLGLGIIGLIMMQQGKGADAGAGFGAGASGSVFGAQGTASFLSRMTAIFATLFFITSLGLAWLNSHKTNTAIDILGASDKEAAADLILPNNATTNPALPMVPQAENNAASASVPVAPSAQPAVNQDVPVVVTPEVPSVAEKVDAPKAVDVPVVEEKATELKSEPEHKVTKAKKK